VLPSAGACAATLGRVGPALGGHRPADQRLEQGSEHGHRRVAVDQPLVLEPGQPAASGVDPAGGVGRLDQRRDQPGHPVGVPGGLGVVDGLFR
jgi:hypothetical protein